MRALRRQDRRLGIFWDPARYIPGAGPPGRWKVQEWVPRWGHWSHVLYWEEDDGTALPLPRTAAPILERLSRFDSQRMGTLGQRFQYLARDLASEDERRAQERRRKLKEQLRERAWDYARHVLGVRSVAGYGKSTRPPMHHRLSKKELRARRERRKLLGLED